MSDTEVKTSFFVRRRGLWVIIADLLMQVFWSTIHLVSKLLSSKMQGLTFAFLRISIAVPMLILLVAIFERKPGYMRPWEPYMKLRNWPSLLVASLFGNIANLSMISYAYYFPNSTASAIGTINSLQTLLVPLIGACVHEESLTLLKVVAMVIGMGGVVVVADPVKFYNDLTSGTGFGDYIGMSIMLLKVTLLSIYVVVNRKFMRAHPTLHPMSFQLGVCVQSVVWLLLGFGWVIVPDLAKVTLNSFEWLTVVYTGAFGSGVAFSIHAWLMANLAPAIFGAIAALLPVVNAIGGLIFFHEAITWWTVGGLVLILAGVGLSVYAKQAEKAAKAKAAAAAEAGVAGVVVDAADAPAVELVAGAVAAELGVAELTEVHFGGTTVTPAASPVLLSEDVNTDAD